MRALREPMDGEFLVAFDVANAANKLYKTIFGPVMSKIAAAKHLIVVPTGPLLSLPFNVLVTEPYEDDIKIVGTDPGLGLFRLFQGQVARASRPASPRGSRSRPSSSAARRRNRTRPSRSSASVTSRGSATTRPSSRGSPRSAGCRKAARSRSGRSGSLNELPGTRGRAGQDPGRAGCAGQGPRPRPGFHRYGRREHGPGSVPGSALRHARPAGAGPGVPAGAGPGHLARAPRATGCSRRARSSISSLTPSWWSCRPATRARAPGQAATELIGFRGAGGSYAAGGESLNGLARSFFFAGARNVHVDALVGRRPGDAGAGERVLQGCLAGAQGATIAEALRKSETKLIDGGELSHPFFWAPFAIIGDGARKLHLDATGGADGSRAGRRR